MPRATTSPIQVKIEIPPGIVTQLAVAVVVFGIAGTTVVLGTALFGSEEKSERAFRVLNWVRKTPDPEMPQPSPQTRSRTGSTARAESARAATVRT